MDQFFLPYDHGDILANNQLDLPLTDEVTFSTSAMKKVFAEKDSNYQRPHIQIKPSWPPRPKLPRFK